MSCATMACFNRGPLALPDRVLQHPTLESVEMIVSEGDEIRIDVYRPEGPGRHATVVLLHGSGGIHDLGSQQVTRYARTLAAIGQVALVVHYFDGTGSFTADDEAERQHYWRWVRDVRAAITWADAQSYVNPRHLSLLGISLGAWLGVGVGAVDARVHRMALMGAGLEPFLADSLRHAPPMLLLHGAEDDEVPPVEAERLQQAMHRAGRRVQMVMYPDEGHTLGDSVSTDALLRAVRFFRSRH
ncbi:dienelactone hydrolase family protein [Gemmatimonas sp.]|uniref:dienelactone hydrolase family protein n=1 Tax=Gemmatimonas sp. TaxID=1962908 RepID=UPI002ED84E63